MVFKNMALIRNVSRDNPLFVGPAMFHYDAKQDTYRKFFDVVRDAVANDVLCAEIGGDVDVVLGSNDEKALVNAFAPPFRLLDTCSTAVIWRRTCGATWPTISAFLSPTGIRYTCTFSTRQFHLMSNMYF